MKYLVQLFVALLALLKKKPEIPTQIEEPEPVIEEEVSNVPEVLPEEEVKIEPVNVVSEEYIEEQSMYKFSARSKDELVSCHPDLQKLMNEVIKYIDITVTKGHRNKKDQDEVFRLGMSKVEWPNSKHNKVPSMAVDIAPYVPSEGGIPWNKPKYFYMMAGIVLTLAAQMGIKLRWGGDFNQNGNYSDDTFVDCPHFELIE